VRVLLNPDRFDRLDQEAASVRSGRIRFLGGSWKLPRLYEAITEPTGGSEAPDADWEGLLTKLKKWCAQKPDSITARVALAETYSHYAWKARGKAYANKVTDEGWRLFEERLRLATLRIPAPGTENDDHNPPRIAPRHLFDIAVGDDNLFRGDKYKWSLRVTAINVTNKVALYNFLSTFSGTHFLTPRTYTAELGFHF
jgi:uncharacterized protein DUF4034